MYAIPYKNMTETELTTILDDKNRHHLYKALYIYVS